jgi:hypothetical protein
MKIEERNSRNHIFPELHWQELDPGALERVHHGFTRAGDRLSGTMAYIRKHKVKLGYYKQDRSGGGWTLLRNITLAPGLAADSPYALALIAHEVLHLQQSLFTRLSVQGELLAWQHQKQVYRELSGREIGEVGEAYSGTQELWEKLAGLSPNSREDLAQAQALMKQIAQRYRSECLPLSPLPKEIWYFIMQGNILAAFAAIYNLITCD